MYTRILVPLDGSAITRDTGRSILAYPISDPSVASSFVDGLEAELPLSHTAFTNGVQREGTEIYPWVSEISIAEAVLAVADTLKVSRIVVPLPLPVYPAG